MKNFWAGFGVLVMIGWTIFGLVWFFLRIWFLPTWTIDDFIIVLPAVTFAVFGIKELSIFMGSRIRGKK